MNITRSVFVLAALSFTSNIWAQDIDSLDTIPSGTLIEIAQNNAAATASPPQTPPVGFTYSNAYEVRADIHKYASVATLPLFATEFALGQSLWNDSDGGSKKSAHAAVGAGIVGLFAVNSVTGVWNLWEARPDPKGKALRTTHGILTLAANAGFVAAWVVTPHDRDSVTGLQDGRSTHRNIALVSIGVGTAGYLIMLFRHH